MVWKFCGKAQFRMARNYAEIVPFHKMKLGEITVFYAVIQRYIPGGAMLI